MLPVNIAKGKCLTRSLGDLFIMSPHTQPAVPAIRYSPYPLPVTAASCLTAATPHQLSQLAAAQQTAGAVLSPTSSFSPLMQTLQTPLEMSQATAIQAGMLGFIPAAKHARTSVAPQQQNITTNLGYNVNDLINIQNLQRSDTVPTFSFPLGF